MNRFSSCLALAGALALGGCPGAFAQNEAVARGDRVLVRSRPSLKGEVVTRLERGQRVLVFEEGLPALFPGEAVTEWTRIELPEGTRVWVSADYVDPAAQEVNTRLLNVRAGPSEDYAVLGRVGRGTRLTVVGGTNGWLEILAPRGLSGFTAAHLLEPLHPPPVEAPPPQPSSPPAETDAEPVPPPTSEPPPGTTTAFPEPEPSPLPAAQPEAAAGPLAKPDPATASPAAEGEPAAAAVLPATPARRLVTREGVVRRTWSLQAPTPFELRGTDTGRRLNYLWTGEDGPDLRGFRGQRVRVSGEEFLDPRWATPLIRVEHLVLTQ